MSEPTLFGPDEQTFCTFRIEDAWFGIEILCVREILRETQVTPVPGAQKCVRGLINLRGQIVTVVNVSDLLGRGPAPLDDGRLIILRHDSDLDARGISHLRTYQDPVGLWVDEIGEVRKCHRSDIRELPGDLEDTEETAALVGVLQLDDRLIRVLEPRLLLPASEGAA